MLQETVQRVAGVQGMDAPLIVCNNDHRFLIAEQLRQIDVRPAAIVLEPVGAKHRTSRCRCRPAAN